MAAFFRDDQPKAPAAEVDLVALNAALQGCVTIRVPVANPSSLTEEDKAFIQRLVAPSQAESVFAPPPRSMKLFL